MNKDIFSSRVRSSTDIPFSSRGPIVYWMQREHRVEDNAALIYAAQLAHSHSLPLVVVFTLVPDFLGATLRQYEFMLKGLEEVYEDCRKKSISFTILLGNPPEALREFLTEHEVSALVCDMNPLRIVREWKKTLISYALCPVYEVDAHNCVPVWVASQKKEYAAATLRPKIHKVIDDYVGDLPHVPQVKTLSLPKIEWTHLRSSLRCDTSVPEVSWCVPGSSEAHRELDDFIEDRLYRYQTERNDPNAHAQSNLSPYLHFGHISSFTIARKISKKVGKKVSEILHASKNKAGSEHEGELSLIDHAGAFLEELIVRKELSDNFCWYEPQYDSVKGFPEWAQESHRKSESDPREYLYSREQLENAETHDDAWNAAQTEMVETGKMHGYMRMYWAKKILEWTPNAEDALSHALYLNDRYELDGRDPNGYVGCAWSIGGVHDRPWFSRPVFGSIRYMNAQGLARKFDLDEYVGRFIR